MIETNDIIPFNQEMMDDIDMKVTAQLESAGIEGTKKILAETILILEKQELKEDASYLVLKIKELQYIKLN